MNYNFEVNADKEFIVSTISGPCGIDELLLFQDKLVEEMMIRGFKKVIVNYLEADLPDSNTPEFVEAKIKSIENMPVGSILAVVSEFSSTNPAMIDLVKKIYLKRQIKINNFEDVNSAINWLKVQ